MFVCLFFLLEGAFAFVFCLGSLCFVCVCYGLPVRVNCFFRLVGQGGVLLFVFFFLFVGGVRYEFNM